MLLKRLLPLNILLLFALSFYLKPKKKAIIPGKIRGAPSWVGHKLWNKEKAPQLQTKKSIEVFIVGGGIAGLSAAWWLQRNGFQNFELHDLDQTVGGNAHSLDGKLNSVAVGAHYIPLAGESAKYVRLLFEDLKVIIGYNKEGLPIYDEKHLGLDPHERLLINGVWQEGILPHFGITEEDRKQCKRFMDLMEEYTNMKGNDGLRAFDIPLAYSSKDPKFRELDKISMKEFLRKKGFNSPSLDWYINYACIDDYGAKMDRVSAWAGVAYFASRNGRAANAKPYDVLTWREGNAWLALQLKKKLGKKIKTDSLVVSIEEQKNQYKIIVWNNKSEKYEQYLAKQVIIATPRFVAPYIIKSYPTKLKKISQAMEYSSWAIAHFKLSRAPRGKGEPLSRENIPYQRPSVGYVVVDHQYLLNSPEKVRDIVLYWPLVEGKTQDLRKKMLQRSYSEWSKDMIDELEFMHPGISSTIKHLDIWLWGHGMVIPKTGFIWSKERKELQKSLGKIHFAHSDMSGFSIFEEAQYHGVEAAKKILLFK